MGGIRGKRDGSKEEKIRKNSREKKNQKTKKEKKVLSQFLERKSEFISQLWCNLKSDSEEKIIFSKFFFSFLFLNYFCTKNYRGDASSQRYCLCNFNFLTIGQHRGDTSKGKVPPLSFLDYSSWQFCTYLNIFYIFYLVLTFIFVGFLLLRFNSGFIAYYNEQWILTTSFQIQFIYFY